MPVTAKLIFKSHVPYRLEHELVNDRGFHVAYRLNGGGVCLQKGYETDDEELEAMYKENDDVPWEEDHPSDDDIAENWWDVKKTRQEVIEKKCDRVYYSFVDPYRHTDAIKDQLKMMCKREHFTPAECELVENWIYCNVL